MTKQDLLLKACLIAAIALLGLTPAASASDADDLVYTTG